MTHNGIEPAAFGLSPGAFQTELFRLICRTGFNFYSNCTALYLAAMLHGIAPCLYQNFFINNLYESVIVHRGIYLSQFQQEKKEEI